MRNKENLNRWQRENYQKRKKDPVYVEMKKRIARKFYHSHKEECLQKCKEYRTKNKERYNKYRREYKRENPRAIYSCIKIGLRKRKKSLDLLQISIEDFVEWYKNQDKTCYYCGRTIEDVKKSKDAFNKKTFRLTIDRKNNDLGYSKENICLACYRCNSIKSDYFTEEEMKQIGEIIKNKHKREVLC